MKAVLGIDLGTTGVRATLLSDTAEVLVRHSRSYPGSNRWIDPATRSAQAEVPIFLTVVKAIIAEVMATTTLEPSAVQGIAVSAMAPGAVAVDAGGQALMPCILWMDRRAVSQAEAVRRLIGEDRIFRLSGNPVDPYYGMIKILWIKDNLPEVYKKAQKILSLKDCVLAWLTGRLVTDVSHAGLYGIAYDIRNNCWDTDILHALELDDSKLPDPLPGDAIAGPLTADAASAVGLHPGTPVAVGGIDSAAGYLACGCVEAGQSAMTLGTSSCWGIYTETALWPSGMNITKAPWNPQGYLINASLAAGGAVLSWLQDLFLSGKQNAERDSRLEELEALAAEVPIGCGGLFTLPHFLGERAPLWDPHARGVLFGLHPGHGRADLYRSAMEGIALSLYRNRLLLQESGVTVDPRIRLTGGSAHSRLFRRILADVLDSTMDYMGEERSSAYGAALLAGRATGVVAEVRCLEETNRVMETTQPDASNHRRYIGLYDRIYRDLYPRMREIYPRLANLPGSEYS